MSVEVTEAEVEAVARAMFVANNPGEDWQADDVQYPGDWVTSLSDRYKHSARAAIIALDEVRGSAKLPG